MKRGTLWDGSEGVVAEILIGEYVELERAGFTDDEIIALVHRREKRVNEELLMQELMKGEGEKP
jgi:hypothetical protein